MRRLTITALAGLVLVTGCGGSGRTSSAGSSDYAGKLRLAASRTSSTSSSRLELTSLTTAQGRTVAITGTGAFDYAAKRGTITLALRGGGASSQPVTIAERITGGNLYLSLPAAPGSFYRIKLSDAAGTTLGSGSDPSSSYSSLAGVADKVTRVGTEKVRGANTTHYRGTIDVQKALAKLSGTNQALVQKNLVGNGVRTLPFDAYLDDQGRLRKYVQHVSVTSKGQQAASTTTIELYDFGTKVQVAVPAPGQVKDGAPLLAALKGQARS